MGLPFRRTVILSLKEGPLSSVLLSAEGRVGCGIALCTEDNISYF
jgi:hypothetical protein